MKEVRDGTDNSSGRAREDCLGVTVSTETGTPDPRPTDSGGPTVSFWEQGLCFLGLWVSCVLKASWHTVGPHMTCGLGREAPWSLTPWAEPSHTRAPSPAVSWASCGVTWPHTRLAGWVGAGSHLAGALQSSGLVLQSRLVPGEGHSQTVSLSAVPAGGT